MAQGEALSRTETPDAPLHLSIPRPHGPVPGWPGVSLSRRSRGTARGASPGRRARIPMLELRGLGGRAVGHDLALATDGLYAVERHRHSLPNVSGKSVICSRTGARLAGES